jgi:hypothetical protein
VPDTWREGARSGDPADVCPLCGAPGCIFASDFKKFGRQSVRVCAVCCKVSNKGKEEGTLAVFKPTEGVT